MWVMWRSFWTPPWGFNTEEACTLRARCRFCPAGEHLGMLPQPLSGEWVGNLLANRTMSCGRYHFRLRPGQESGP